MRALLNRWRRKLVRVLMHRMLFGEQSQGRDLPHTRIHASSCIEHEERLELADHVFIGAFNFIEASGGVRLGEGVQITSHCVLTTHSAHRSLRLLGRAYVAWQGERPGWVAGPIAIGAWSFIGPHSLIEAGSTLGRGSLVKAYSRVRGRFPDFAILEGNPAVQVGDTRELDARWLAAHPELRAHHEAWSKA
jgi:acetyltransferase-like isoleucine patch superfamily enzyme